MDKNYEKYGLNKKLVEIIYAQLSEAMPIVTHFADRNLSPSLHPSTKQLFLEILFLNMPAIQYHELADAISSHISETGHYEFFRHGLKGYGISFHKMTFEEINPVLRRIDDMTIRQRDHWDRNGWEVALEDAIERYESLAQDD